MPVTEKLLKRMLAACLEQNASQNIAATVIEHLSYNITLMQNMFLLKALTVAMTFLNLAEVVTLKQYTYWF